MPPRAAWGHGWPPRSHRPQALGPAGVQAGHHVRGRSNAGEYRVVTVRSRDPGARPIRSPGGAGASPLGVPRTHFWTCPPYDVVGAVSRGQPIGQAVLSAVATALTSWPRLGPPSVRSRTSGTTMFCPNGTVTGATVLANCPKQLGLLAATDGTRPTSSTAARATAPVIRVRISQTS